MKCGCLENDVALYIEGDLTPAKACEIQAHLVSCGACRDLATGLRESQAILKSLKQDTVGVAALSSVRARVLAEVGSSRARSAWGRWVYAVAGTVFVGLVCIGIASKMRVPAPPIPQIVESDPLPPPAAVPLTRETVTTPPDSIKSEKVTVPLRAEDGRRRRQGAAHTEPPAEPPKPLVVKLLTDDPDIVIYWLVDEKNGGTL